MPKRRISDIVYQSRTLQNIAAVFADDLVYALGIFVDQPTEDSVTERSGELANLQRVSKACSYKITAFERIYLRLVLKSTK